MNINDSKNRNPPYLLGLLCLIPIVGIFIGIGLILAGIFRYKDRKLILIGLIGILITVAIYSFLFYKLDFRKNTIDGFAKISQEDVNDLVKEIEFYKLTNDRYPDSLQQLINSDKIISINDPLLIIKMDEKIKTTFQYKKLGQKYTLFSAGIDGISGTRDDIYPNIVVVDTSKFGLIRVMPDSVSK
jgi:D-alanyl-lipoteichoic acid acyltransferase DltB (MBOAT superfamily)